MVVAGPFLSLSRATIKSRLSVEASAKLAWLDGITAEKEVSFRLRFAEVSMCDANLADDTYIEHLLTLAGTPLSKVIIRHVDLRACRFTGARDLPSLTLDDRVELPRAPRTGRLMILDEFLWRKEKKPNRARPRGALVLAEERLVAANRADSATWSESLNNLRKVLVEPGHENVESTYRTLRKSLEDRGDKPGADDFYYGEMQMRRWTPRSRPFLAWATKKIVLTLYWLAAGYGHRASRAALCLGVLAVLGGLLLVLTAAAPDHSLGFGEAVFDSIQLCISPLTRADPGLRYSGWGQLVRLSLLILGPAIAAVMVFALHARIRR